MTIEQNRHITLADSNALRSSRILTTRAYVLAGDLIRMSMEHNPGMKIELWHFYILARTCLTNGIEETLAAAISCYPFLDEKGRNLVSLFQDTLTNECVDTLLEGISIPEKTQKEHIRHTLWQLGVKPQRVLAGAVLQEQGLNISFNDAGRTLLEHYLKEKSPKLPFSEYYKREKVLKINGFSAARLSVLHHDVFDHVYFFDLMERSGTYHQFEKLFVSLGNPQERMIFCREGEFMAGVPLAWRNYCQTAPDAPLFAGMKKSSSQESYLEIRPWITGVLGNAGHSLPENLLHYVLLHQLAEQEDQLRKWGAPVVDGALLSLADPTYLELLRHLVELTATHEQASLEAVRKMNVVSEYVLTRRMSEQFTFPSIGTQEFERLFEVAMNSLEPGIIAWLDEHPHFSAVGYAL
jgi:hypothetical protein